MTIHKLTGVATLAVALMAFGANAQDKPKTEGQPPARNPQQMQERGARVAAELKLTDEQKPKFEAVMKEAGEKRRALRDETSLTPEQRREKMMAIQEEVKTKLKAILTPEQMTKWEEMAKQRPRGGPGGPGGKPADEPKK
jgi:Spy/CpxP family protein refolding chaperone